MVSKPKPLSKLTEQKFSSSSFRSGHVIELTQSLQELQNFLRNYSDLGK